MKGMRKSKVYALDLFSLFTSKMAFVYLRVMSRQTFAFGKNNSLFFHGWMARSGQSFHLGNNGMKYLRGIFEARLLLLLIFAVIRAVIFGCLLDCNAISYIVYQYISISGADLEVSRIN